MRYSAIQLFILQDLPVGCGKISFLACPLLSSCPFPSHLR